MVFARFLQTAVFAAGFVSALAKNCRTNEADGAYPSGIPTLYVSSQEDLDHLDGCTNLTGNIVILPDYSGPFKLNGVTDMTGGILMNGSEYSENVESFEMLDVVTYAGGLELYQVSDVRLPKVERLDDGLSLRSYKGGQADLGALVEAEFIGIGGIWETNLKSLRHVGRSGVIFTSVVIDPWKEQQDGSIEIVLPALESTASLDILGTISRLSLPRLSNITRDPLAYGGKLFNSTIRVDIPPLDVDLPALTTLDASLAVQGSVSTLNVSSLVQAGEDIFIETETWSDISFPVLEHAQGLHLAGSISSLNFPALRSATVLDIFSAKSSCNGNGSGIYIAPYDATKDPEPDWCTADSTTSSSIPSATGTIFDSSYSGGNTSNPQLQPGAIAGIVIGCVFAVVVGLLGLRIWSARNKKTEREQSAAPSGQGGRDSGPVPAYRGDDAPPPYSTSPGP